MFHVFAFFAFLVLPSCVFSEDATCVQAKLNFFCIQKGKERFDHQNFVHADRSCSKCVVQKAKSKGVVCFLKLAVFDRKTSNSDLAMFFMTSRSPRDGPCYFSA